MVLPDRPGRRLGMLREPNATGRGSGVSRPDWAWKSCCWALGRTLRFLHPRLLQSLARAGVGVEVMDTRAACRTYNILLAEGRKVAAALIL